MKPSNFSPTRRRDLRRRGSVLPLVALSITMLLGAAALAVDYSVLLADKNQLQRACDAAALAGAAYLKRSPNNETSNTDNARNEALLVAGLNNLAAGEVTADRVTFSEDKTRIRVAAQRSRSLFFARIMGIVNGDISAFAVAVCTPPAVMPVPIAITTVSKDRYQSDGLPHDFTLVRPQNTAFKTNYDRAPAFDPFTLFDLRGGSSSPPKMQQQLEGDLNDPVNPQIGDLLTTMRPDLGTLSEHFKAGISPRFQKAALPPWLDPLTGLLPLTQPWQMVGTSLNDILGRTAPANNPRIVSFVVLNEVDAPITGGDLPIVDFATAYISSVQDTAGGLTFTATFLPPGTSNGSAVALVE